MMKKFLPILLALMLLVIPAALAEEYDDYEDGNPPLAPEISLPANPSTGYVWSFEVDDPCVDVMDHGVYVEDEDLVGAGGMHSFRLNGSEPGYAEIIFTYGRPWEDEPLQTVICRVIVEENYNVMIYEFVMQ